MSDITKDESGNLGVLTEDASKMSRRENVYLKIRAAIADGTYRPAQRLVEADLAKWLSVSKTPVREALYRLQQEGLVESVRNKGFTVRVISTSEMREIYELREIYEGLCARSAALGECHEVLAQDLLRLNSEASDALNQDDVIQVHRLFSKFDHAIFAQSSNRMLREQVERLAVLIGLSGTASNYIPGRIRRSITQHVGIVEAIAAGDPDQAECRTREHIRSLLADQIQNTAAVESINSRRIG